MTKTEIASYLVSLHTLMEAQSKVGDSIPSQTLAEEYNKHWKLLKDEIGKESEDETRNRSNSLRTETAADQSRGETRSSGTNWNSNLEPPLRSSLQRPGNRSTEA